MFTLMKTDMIIEGMRQALKDTGALKASAISKKAGKDVSTMRKILDGTSKNPKLQTLEVLANAMNLTLAELEHRGRSVASPPELQHDIGLPPSGFSEPEATPFVMNPNRAGNLPTDHLAALARSPQIWRADQSLISLGLIRGDIFVTDAQAKACAGDIVVATEVNPDSGTSRTIIRQYLPPYLVPADPADRYPMIIDDENYIRIMGVIIGVVRVCMKQSVEEGI